MKRRGGATSRLRDWGDGRAMYSEGRLVAGKAGTTADPKPTAGKVGTQITVMHANSKLC